MKIGTAIRKIRRQQGLTLQQLCDAAGGDMQTGYLSRIETDKLTPSVLVVRNIARALGTTIDELINAGDEFHPYKGTVACRKIPVFPFHKTANDFLISAAGMLTAKRTIPSPVPLSYDGFALVLEDNSMQCDEGVSFTKGGIVIFVEYHYNPLVVQQQLKPGDFVLVKDEDRRNTLPLFRELIFDGSEMMLRPRNSRYPIRPVPKNPKFVGKAVAQVLEIDS